MIVRAWNVSLGTSSAGGRRSYLREMVELVTADRPGIVCLQDVPAWALDKVGEWADMGYDAVRTRRAKLVILPVPAAIGRRLGSKAAGVGNVILVPKDAKIRERKQITLNTNPFCEEQAQKLGLDMKLARKWERDRRVCHLVKIELANRRRILVANLRTTNHPDPRLADAELGRAAKFVDRASEIDEIVVVAGDFNIALAQSATLHDLTTRDIDGYWQTGPATDHMLVREGRPSEMRRWTDDERTYDGKLLSDHAPVEIQLLGKARPKPPSAPQPAQPAAQPQPAPEPPPAKVEDDRWETKGDRWETKDAGWEESEKWDTER